MARTPSTLPLLECAVDSVTQALKAASFAPEPKNDMIACASGPSPACAVSASAAAVVGVISDKVVPFSAV